MKNGIKAFFLVFTLLHCSFIHAQEEDNKSIDLGGYINDLQTVYFQNDSDSLLTSNLIHNRINLKCTFSNSFYARVELRNRIIYGETVKYIPGYARQISNDDGYYNLSWLWLDRDAIAGVSEIDRLHFNFSFNKMQITAGRQRINWGVNTIWNPNDLFNAYNFLDFDYEERPGTDAIRIQYNLNAFSSVEFDYSPSKEKEKSVAAALFKINRWNYDFQFLGGIYDDDFVIGTGWAGNIFDAGFKGELTYFFINDDVTNNDDDFIASIMFDYSLKNSWYVSATALYIQNPAVGLTEYPGSISNNQYVKNLMPYEWSFHAGVMKLFTPLLSGNLAVIYSPDNQLILFPLLSYSVAENFDLDLASQSFINSSKGDSKTSHSITLRMSWNF